MQDPQDPPLFVKLRSGLANGRVPASLRAMNEYVDEQAGSWDSPIETGVSVAATLGTGLVEGSLRLGRGVNWLANSVADVARLRMPMGSVDPERDWGIPKTVSEALPEDLAVRLESRLSKLNPTVRGGGEFVGEILSFLGGGAGAGIVGKAFGAPGKVIEGLGGPGAMLGSRLAQSPKLARWAKAAEQTLPPLIGGATGFGLYNYMTAEGGWDERLAAGAHGLVAGGAVGIAGALGRVAEMGVLNKLATPAERANWTKVLEDLNAGKINFPWWKRTAAKTLNAAIENTGLAGLNEDFWKAVSSGDYGTATELWAMSFPAVLLAKGANFQSFRRQRPDLNNLGTRMERDAMRQEPQQQQLPYSGPDKPPELQAPQDPKPPGGAGPEAPAPAGAPSQAARVVDPLFQSGWEMPKPIEAKETGRSIRMEFPGSGEVTIREVGEGYEMSVPASVFRMVRGDIEVPEGTQDIRMVGAVAEEFARDLAAVSMLRRIRGEIMFGAQGEAWEGGPWRGEDGRSHTIGLDGKHYSREGIAFEGAEPWKKEPDAPLPVQDSPLAQDPQIQRWSELTEALRKAGADSPGLDLLEASLALVMRGDPNSKSVQQTFRFLAMPWQAQGMNADVAAPLLRPDTIEQFGLTVGQLASGHMTAEIAQQQVAAALTAPPPQPQVQPDPASRDWFAAEPKERRKAAMDYAAEKLEAGQEVTTGEMRDTFGIPRETARDIIKQARKSPLSPEEDRRLRSAMSGISSMFGGKKRPKNEKGIVSVDLLVSPATALFEGILKAGKIAKGLYDYAIRDQVRSIERKSGERTLSDEMRSAMSRTRTIFGEAARAVRPAMRDIRKKRNELAKVIDVPVRTADGGSVQVPMGTFTALVEGRLPDGDAAIRDAAQKYFLVPYEYSRRAGGTVMRPNFETGKMEYVRMRETDVPTLPRVFAEGHRRVMETDTMRLAFWQDVAAMNPDMTIGTGDARRPITAEDMERVFQSTRNVEAHSAAEREAAFEMARWIKNLPARWRGQEILETDPLVIMHRVGAQQAARAASIEQWGQDRPDSVRRQFNLQRRGVEDRLEQFRRGLSERGVENQDALVKEARETLSRIQGKEPEQVGPLGRMVDEVLAVKRAFLTWKSGVQDIGGMLAEPLYAAGFRRSVRLALDAVLRRGGPLQSAAEDAGSLHHELGHLDMGLATEPLGRFAEVLSGPSNYLERIKTAYFDRLATRMLHEFGKGWGQAGDRRWLIDNLNFRPDQADALMGGTADAALQQQFRHELVQNLAARGRPAERSRAAASPMFRRLVPFTMWATKRAFNVGKDVAALARAIRGGASVGEIAGVAKRLMYRGIGIQLGGLVGTLFYYMVADWTKGENGADRFVRDVVNFPEKMFVRSFVSQLLAGPLGTLANAWASDGEGIERLTEATSIPAGIMQARFRGSSPVDIMGWFQYAYDVVEGAGFISRDVRSAAAAAQAAMLGVDRSYQQIAKEIRDFDRLSGTERAWSTPKHQEEFYAAMREVKTIIEQHPAGESGLWEKVKPEVEKALDLQPGETVAAKLRAMQLAGRYSGEERDKLTTYLGDTKWSKAMEHDAVVLQLAREAGRLDGTEPTEWGDAVQMASRQARLGSPNAWGDLVDRAVAEAAAKLQAQQPYEDRLAEIAGAIATNPESMDRDRSFTDEMKQAATMLDRWQLGDYLQAKFMKRAAEHWKRSVRDDLKRDAADQNK